MIFCLNVDIYLCSISRINLQLVALTGVNYDNVDHFLFLDKICFIYY